MMIIQPYLKYDSGTGHFFGSVVGIEYPAGSNKHYGVQTVFGGLNYPSGWSGYNRVITPPVIGGPTFGEPPDGVEMFSNGTTFGIDGLSDIDIIFLSVDVAYLPTYQGVAFLCSNLYSDSYINAPYPNPGIPQVTSMDGYIRGVFEATGATSDYIFREDRILAAGGGPPGGRLDYCFGDRILEDFTLVVFNAPTDAPVLQLAWEFPRTNSWWPHSYPPHLPSSWYTGFDFYQNEVFDSFYSQSDHAHYIPTASLVNGSVYRWQAKINGGPFAGYSTNVVDYKWSTGYVDEPHVAVSIVDPVISTYPTIGWALSANPSFVVNKVRARIKNEGGSVVYDSGDILTSSLYGTVDTSLGGTWYDEVGNAVADPVANPVLFDRERCTAIIYVNTVMVGQCAFTKYDEGYLAIDGEVIS